MDSLEGDGRISPVRVWSRPVPIQRPSPAPTGTPSVSNPQSDGESSMQDDRVIAPPPDSSNDSSPQSSLHSSPVTSPRRTSKVPDIRAAATKAARDENYSRQFFRENPNLLKDEIRVMLGQQSRSASAASSQSRRAPTMVQLPSREDMPEAYAQIYRKAELLVREKTNLENDKTELEAVNAELQTRLSTAQSGYNAVIPERERMQARVNEDEQRIASLIEDIERQKVHIEDLTCRLDKEMGRGEAARRVNAQLSEDMAEIHEANAEREEFLQTQIHGLADNVGFLVRERRETGLRMAVREEEVAILRGELDKSRSWQEMMRNQQAQLEAELWDRNQREDARADDQDVDRKKSLADEFSDLDESIDDTLESESAVNSASARTQTCNDEVEAALDEAIAALNEERRERQEETELSAMESEVQPTLFQAETLNQGTQTEEAALHGMVDSQTQTVPTVKMVSTGTQSQDPTIPLVRQPGMVEERLRRIAADAQRRIDARLAEKMAWNRSRVQRADEPEVLPGPDLGTRLIFPGSLSEEILQSISQSRQKRPFEEATSPEEPKTPGPSGGVAATEGYTGIPLNEASPANSDKSWVAVDESGCQLPSPPVSVPASAASSPRNFDWERLISPKDTRFDQTTNDHEEISAQSTNSGNAQLLLDRTSKSPRPASGKSSSSKSSSSSSDSAPDDMRTGNSDGGGDSGSSGGKDGAGGAGTASGDPNSSSQAAPDQPGNTADQPPSGDKTDRTPRQPNAGNTGLQASTGTRTKLSENGIIVHDFGDDSSPEQYHSPPRSSSGKPISSSPKASASSSSSPMASNSNSSQPAMWNSIMTAVTNPSVHGGGLLIDKPGLTEGRSMRTQVEPMDTGASIATQVTSSVLGKVLQPLKLLLGLSSIDERDVMTSFSVSRRHRRVGSPKATSAAGVGSGVTPTISVSNIPLRKIVKWTPWSLFYSIWRLIFAFLLFQVHQERQLWRESNASKKLEILSWKDDHWGADLMAKMSYRVVKMGNLDRNAFG